MKQEAPMNRQINGNCSFWNKLCISFLHACYMWCFLNRSKYFRGKRLHGDYDIRVEQAEFKELSLTANAESGTTVSMAVFRNGTKVVRSFRPDFVLIRQNLRDAGENNKNLLLGFKFGGVPSINSLHAIYNFQVRKIFSWYRQRISETSVKLPPDYTSLEPRTLPSWGSFIPMFRR